MTAAARPPAAGAALRADIEGLRAVAVTLVIVYHYFPALLPGGYVGVDVFFVISGFLITNSLLHTRARAASRAAWLWDFWARRARRLLPNALLVLVAAGMAGLALYSQFSLKRLGSDIAWSAVFSANWLFVLRSIDYLVWDETQKGTLLHFWSLAVEEQFYLAWPLLLALLTMLQRPGRRLAVLSVLMAASLALCLLMSQRNLTHAFFSTPARAWELLAGAALALHPPMLAPRLRGVAAAIGLGAIGVAGATFSDDTRHPGLVTLLPVLGCALVIAADAQRATVTRWLASAPLQAVGARSYSIYLWHWPVLMMGAAWPFARQGLGAALLLSGALVLAELAYRGVERPARFVWARSWSSRRVLAAGLSAAVLVAVFGLLVRAWGANDLRETLGMRPVSQSASLLPPLARVRDDLPPIYRNGCHLGVDAEASPDCLSGAPGASDAVVLFGDSHAAQWFSAVDAVAAAHGLALHSWTKSSCPSADVAVWNGVARSAYRQCDVWREATLQRIEALRPRLVVLSNLVESSPELADPTAARPLRGREAALAWSEGFERLIARLQRAGITVVVIRDIPRPRPDVLDCIYAASDPARCELDLAEATAVPAFDVAVARRRGVVVWDFATELCPAGRCTVVRADTHQPVYRDFNHLTDTEVRRLAPALAARWQALPLPAAGALR